MQMDYGLKLELTQKLIMTPELRQAIAILQLSSFDLCELVEQELQENPVLEIEDPPSEDLSDASTEQTAEDSSQDSYEWMEYFQDDTPKGSIQDTVSGPHENVGVYTKTLHEHLELQLNLMALNQRERELGSYLIGCIDDNGYLICTLDEVGARLKRPYDEVERMLYVLQTFDPVGVASRDLKECLRLQLDYRQVADNLVNQIIMSFLDEVAAGRCKVIAGKLHTTPADVQAAIDIIKTLDPKPGRAFAAAGDPGYIVPDITVEEVNGTFVILVNDTSVPRLTISSYYKKVVRNTDLEAKKFIEGRLNAAAWLIKSIEQRRRTLYRVMEQLIHFQYDFFKQGPKYLCPLTMKKVADAIEMHESTVSRAIANKYVTTPHGLFALRTFFSASIHSSSGPDVAASQAKDELKALVASENPKKPLSDQLLSDLLSKKGIILSRRTVTKYREELGISSSNKRKRY
jgi:RNA polymerase sigma-54 factor